MVPQPLPRSYRGQQQARDLEKISRIVSQAVDPEPSSSAGATAGGDGRRLRGIPVVGRSTVGGAVFGTDPVRALLSKERQRQR